MSNTNADAAEVTDSPASENAGVAEIADKDLMLKILSAIDSGERVPMEQIPDYDFKDGFEIILEYQIQEGLIMHPDMARHLVFMDDGICCLFYGDDGKDFLKMADKFDSLVWYNDLIQGRKRPDGHQCHDWSLIMV